MLDKEQIKANVKLITNEENEALINLLINKSIIFIKGYCNLTQELLKTVEDIADIVEDMTVYKINMLNKENIKAETVGNFTISYDIYALPVTLQARIKNIGSGGKGKVRIW